MLLTASTVAAAWVEAVDGWVAAVMGSPRDSPPHNGEGRIGDLRGFLAGFLALRPAGIRRRVLLGGRLDERAHLVAHRLHPVGALGPLGAIPLGHIDLVVAVMVLAG